MESETLSRIDKTLGIINTHPEYCFATHKEAKLAFREEAQRHSRGLEEKAREKGRPYNPKDVKKIELAMDKSMNIAWDYLATHGIDISSLARLGNIITPDTSPNPSFRRGNNLSFGGFVPPASDNVIFEVNSLIEFLNSDSVHPVIRAAEAHLDLVRIHPYGDGNGRAARLLQDFCLEERGYPPAMIPLSDRKLYHNIIFI